jgi:hypothetical protein
MNSRLLISFSGGETSAYMAWRLLREKAYSAVAVVFANTGEEREETLEFIKACDEAFGFKTVWVEAVQFQDEAKTDFKVVTFQTASRRGEPFEAAIKKYGIPNSGNKQCTKVLKRYPLERYARSIGWAPRSYDIAIGIRADEIDRMSTATDRSLVYPLVKAGISKAQIIDWWSRQPFRLQLKSYQGNCKWCWKKSWRKHYTLIAEDPAIYDFPKRMEALYAKVGPEFRREPPPPPDYKRSFFRGDLSTEGLFAEYDKKKARFVPALDESRNAGYASLFDDRLDLGNGCEESCEVYSDEDN